MYQTHPGNSHNAEQQHYAVLQSCQVLGSFHVQGTSEDILILSLSVVP